MKRFDGQRACEEISARSEGVIRAPFARRGDAGVAGPTSRSRNAARGDSGASAVGREIFSQAQKGESNLGCILWGLLLVIVVYLAWMLVPVKIASAQLSDFIEDQAKWAEHRSPARIKKEIVAKAQDLRLPLDPKKVHVERRGDHIYMKAEYVVPVEFIGGYTYEWHFKHDIDRPIYIF